MHDRKRCDSAHQSRHWLSSCSVTPCKKVPMCSFNSHLLAWNSCEVANWGKVVEPKEHAANGEAKKMSEARAQWKLTTAEAAEVSHYLYFWFGLEQKCIVRPAKMSRQYEERERKKKTKRSASLSASDSAQLPAAACEMLTGRFEWLGDVGEEVSASCTPAKKTDCHLDVWG